MILTAITRKRLEKMGYNDLELESLIDRLPRDVWVNILEKKIKRKRASFVFTRSDNLWRVALSVIDDDTGEIYVIHRTESESLKECVGQMLLFLSDTQMTDGTAAFDIKKL